MTKEIRAGKGNIPPCRPVPHTNGPDDRASIRDYRDDRTAFRAFNEMKAPGDRFHRGKVTSKKWGLK